MKNVIDINNYIPHNSGKAICIACGHEQYSVAPTKVDWLECDKCRSMKSRFKYPFCRTDDLHFECNCGNDLFYLSENGFYCPNCGKDMEV